MCWARNLERPKNHVRSKFYPQPLRRQGPRRPTHQTRRPASKRRYGNSGGNGCLDCGGDASAARASLTPKTFNIMQKKFNTIINGKGGVGKSFFAVNFVQFLKDKAIAHTAVDTDNENSILKRFHSESLFLDIEDPTEIDSVFATLDKTDLVVMD